MYLNDEGISLTKLVVRLIETIVVFELIMIWKNTVKQWRLIETIVVFEFMSWITCCAVALRLIETIVVFE